jgi:hypothetical protein
MTFRKDITLMAFIFSAIFWGSGYAADNSIYIDQAGDSSTINVTQDGAGNKVKGILLNGTAGATTDPAKLNGNAQTINIEQTGSGNTLAIGAVTTQGGTVTGYSNIGTNINYKVTGDSNIGYINMNNGGTGGATGNVVDIQQTGNTNNASLTMNGTSNQFTVGTNGSSNILSATVNANQTVTSLTETGNANNTTLSMTGNKGQVSILTDGASNTTNVTQSASGTTGAQAIIDITGSSNNTAITQSGGFDHYASVKINSTQSGSDSNTVTIAQSGGGTGGHIAIVDLTGASNTIGITQSGSIDNLANIKVTGSSNNYTILQRKTN